jgi:hypothetical protein
MNAFETRQEVERLRGQADRWRDSVKNFNDDHTINVLIEYAAELNQKADAMEAELAARYRQLGRSARID